MYICIYIYISIRTLCHQYTPGQHARLKAKVARKLHMKKRHEKGKTGFMDSWWKAIPRLVLFEVIVKVRRISIYTYIGAHALPLTANNYEVLDTCGWSRFNVVCWLFDKAKSRKDPSNRQSAKTHASTKAFFAAKSLRLSKQTKPPLPKTPCGHLPPPQRPLAFAKYSPSMQHSSKVSVKPISGCSSCDCAWAGSSESTRAVDESTLATPASLPKKANQLNKAQASSCTASVIFT